MRLGATLTGGGPAVQATGLIKAFENGRRTIWQRLRGAPDKRSTFRAVDGIDLVVERGEIFGLLGPNGAGKTTMKNALDTPRADRGNHPGSRRRCREGAAEGARATGRDAVPLGRWAFDRAERRMRVHGTLGQC